MTARKPKSPPPESPPPESVSSLEDLRAAVGSCQRCPLWKTATQGVSGEGAEKARVMLVGEQPGDQEDLAGKPFVGPAGQLLDRALVEAGIDRGTVYVTNVVKHFSWIARGKRRLHKKPTDREIEACIGWLHAEVRIVQPETIVCLGATAAQTLLGRDIRVMADRGRFFESDLARRVLVTVHPSSILRIPSEDRAQAYVQFVADLKRIHARE